MKKKMLSTGIVITGATLLVLSYLSGTNNASAVNRYDSGSKKYEQEIYYTQDEFNTKETLNEEVYSETPLAGNAQYDLSVLEEDFSKEVKTIKKVEVQKTEKKKESENKWNISLSHEEIDLLAKIVWIECRGESDKGQQAVIEVIFNRMIHESFNGTLYEVLSKKRQFSSWKSRNKAEPTDKEYKNIYIVLNGESEILDLDTVYFSTSPRNKNITIHIGGHYFCRYENN
jgi:spore germination cell wall hydrolase CwlJ-like protein